MLLDIVKKIVSEQGEQILSDPKRVNAFFLDLAREEPKPKKSAFVKCLEHGFAKILKDVAKDERASCEEILAQRLYEEEGLDLKLCKETIDVLSIVLFSEPEDSEREILLNENSLLKKKIAELTVEIEYLKNNVAINQIAQKQDNYFIDPRDGKVYKTVKIGNQIWMAENLNYNAYGSKCYKNDPKNTEKYGRLYDWETAMKVCPPGWHLPTNKEWDELIISVGGRYTTGKHLKAKFGWNDNIGKSGNGLDTYSFAALPGGYGYSDGSFGNVGYNGNWWSASESCYASNAYLWRMYYNREDTYYYNYRKSDLFSIRCLQNKA